jgi:hypothetical protein
MKKSIILIFILAIIIVVLSAILFWPKKVQSPGSNNNQISVSIEILSPKPNDIISSPLKITGVVRGNGWSGFEGQVGTVKLLDNTGNELAKGVLRATTEWTTVSVDFEADLEFTSPGFGFGTLVFGNENPSGDPVRDKTFILPITFK